MRTETACVLPESIGRMLGNHLILQCGAAARVIAERYVHQWQTYFTSVAAGEIDEAAEQQLGAALVEAVEAFRNLGVTLDRATEQHCDTTHDDVNGVTPGAHEATPDSQ